MVFNKCCCCVDLRVGTQIIAILEIVIGLSGLGMGITWKSIVAVIIGVGSGACLMWSSWSKYIVIKYKKPGIIMYLVVSMIGIVIYVFAASFMFVGLNEGLRSINTRLEKNVTTLNVWGEPEDMAKIKAETFEFLTGTVAVIGVAYLVVALVKLYFWICVYSFLKGVNRQALRYKTSENTKI